MNKLLLFTVVVIFGLTSVNAQDEDKTSGTTTFGASAGFNSFIITAKADGASASTNVSGFYVGIFADMEVSDDFHIQPELQYVNLREDGESGNMIVIPIVAKYYVSEEFNLQFGPLLDFIVDESEGLNTFGYGFAAGLGFDINDNLLLSSKYSFGLNNRLQGGSSEVKVKFNFFQVGLGYKFN